MDIMEPEASFYSDCPTDLIPSAADSKNTSKQYSNSPQSESSDDLINFLDCGTVETDTSVLQHWKVCDISKYESDFYDFGSVSIDWGVPLILRFYVDEKKDVLTQVGIYHNVTPEEMLVCFESQRRFNKFISIYISMEKCSEDNVIMYNKLLSDFFTAILLKKREVILKCVLDMNLYEFSSILADTLSSLSNSFVEINIGKPRELDQALYASPDLDDGVEANGIVDLLKVWLKENRKTLRCLRVYEQFILNDITTSIVSECYSVTHLTLSKVVTVKASCSFPTIQSFEYDVQCLGFTDEEVRFSKNIKTIFPNVNIVCFKGTSYDPLINSFLRSQHTVESGQTVELYQPVTDLRKVQHQLSLIYPKKEKIVSQTDGYPRTLTIINPKFKTKIVLYRAGEIFINPY